MAIDRTTAQAAGERLTKLYFNLERRLIDEVSRRIVVANSDPDSVQWAQRHLREVTELRRVTDRLTTSLGHSVRGEAAAAILEASKSGRRAALRELSRFEGTKGLGAMLAAARKAFDSGEDLPGAGALQTLGTALEGKLSETGAQITRWAVDAYQTAITSGANAAVPGVLAGIDTRRRASERAWNELLNRGVTGFVDKAGKSWQLSTYVEMATRTATMQAAVESHSAQLGTLGLDFVIVSDVAGECPLCRPWEGKVLSRTGAGGPRTVSVQSAVDDDMVTVAVAGSLTEARAAGLFHPQCRHNVSAYVPGATRVPTGPTADPDTNAARTELRSLERDMRKWRLRQAGAVTREGRLFATAKIGDLDDKITDLIKARGGVERGLPRRRDREQPDLGFRSPGTTGRRKLPPLPKRPPPAPTRPAGGVAGGSFPRGTPIGTVRPGPAGWALQPPTPTQFVQPAPAVRPAAPVVPPRGTKPDASAPWRQDRPDPGARPGRPGWMPGTVPGAHGKTMPNPLDLDTPAPRAFPEFDSRTLPRDPADVARAKAYVDQLTRGIQDPLARTEIGALLDMQAELAPRTMLDLRRVWGDAGPNYERLWRELGGSDGINGFYATAPTPHQGGLDLGELGLNPEWFTRAPKYSWSGTSARGLRIAGKRDGIERTDWSSPGGMGGGASTGAHEFGHHVARQFLGQRGQIPGSTHWTGTAVIDDSVLDELFDPMARELGIAKLSRGRAVAETDISSWIQANPATFKRAFSEYGTSSAHELLAEIWGEYSTLGLASRPLVYDMGRRMQALAERMAP